MSFLPEILSLVVGALYPLGFAPFGLFPLSILALSGLFALWRGATPSRAFLRGLLFGLASFGIGVSWIFTSVRQFGGIGPLVAFPITGLFIFVMALYPACIGYIANRVFIDLGWWRRLFFGLPALWVLGEWLRSFLFTGFPWLNLGDSQIDSFLAGFAPVFGVFGVSWVAAMTSGLFLILAGEEQAPVFQSVFSPVEQKPAWARWMYRHRRRLAAVMMMAVLWLGGGVLREIEWTRPHGQPISVSLVQGNINQTEKWDADQLYLIIKEYWELTESHLGDPLILWPETAIPTFYQTLNQEVTDWEARVKAHHSLLLIGMPVLNEQTQGYYNSVIALGDTSRGFYHKRHLVPFGEYTPWSQWVRLLTDQFDIPMADYSKGEVPPILKVGNLVLGMTICYEDAFGYELQDAFPESTLLINMSNDGWFGDSLAPHQHLQIARMRALETGRYLLRATNTGISAIILPTGKLQAKTPQFQKYVLHGTVQPKTGITPYLYFGNIAILIGLIISLLIPVIRILKRYG